MSIRNVVLFGLILSTLAACGGGGSQPGNQNSQALPSGNYKLTFSAISTARLATPISGIEIAVKLPAGLSVSTLTGGSGQINPLSVSTGSAIGTAGLAFGSYSASTHTAYLSMVTTQENYRGGQYLNLLFNVPPHSSVTPNDVFVLNDLFPRYRVVGLDTVTHNSVVMTGNVTTTLGIAF